MPVLTKLALHLSRFAAASHQTAASSLRGAFQSGGAAAATGSSTSGAGSTASGLAGGLSSAGASGAGAGAGGAKFHAGRGAYSTYTAGRGIVQANASSSDSTNSRTDDEEERAQAGALASSKSSGKLRSHQDVRRSTLITSTGQLTNSEMRNRFSRAFSTTRGQMLITSSAIESTTKDNSSSTALVSTSSNNERIRRNSTSAVEGPSTTQDSTPLPSDGASMESDQVRIANDKDASTTSSSPSPQSPSPHSKLPLYNQLMAVQKHGDEIIAHTLVRKFRALDPSQQATASYNAALEALFWVRRRGHSVKPLTDTYVEMIEKNIIPNNRTFSVLVRALCANDSEIQERKQEQQRSKISLQASSDEQSAKVTSTSPMGKVEESSKDSSSQTLSADDSFAQALQLLGVAHKSQHWFHSAEPYNAVLRSCAYRGNADEAISVLSFLESSAFAAPDSQTFKHLIDTFSNGAAQEGETQAETQRRKLEACNQVFKSWEEMKIEAAAKQGDEVAERDLNADRSVWNSLIRAHFQLGDEAGGIALLERMLSSLSSEEAASTSPTSAPSPDVATFSTIISSFLQLSDVDSALAWFFKLDELRQTSVELMLPLPDGRTLIELAVALNNQLGETWPNFQKALALNKVLSAFYDQAAENVLIFEESELETQVRPFLPFGLFNSSIHKLMAEVKGTLRATTAAPLDPAVEEQLSVANALLDDVLAHIEFQYRLFAGQMNSRGISNSLINSQALINVVRTLTRAQRPADAAAVLSYAAFALPEVTEEGEEQAEVYRGRATIRAAALSILGAPEVDVEREEPTSDKEEVEVSQSKQLSPSPIPASVLLQIGLTFINDVLSSFGPLPKAHKYRIAHLYRLARQEVNGSVEELGLGADAFKQIFDAFLAEEFVLRPVNFEAFESDGLGMLMKDAMKLEQRSEEGGNFIDPNSLYGVVLARYGQEKAIEVVGEYSPSIARKMQASGEQVTSSRSDSVSQSVSGSETSLSQSANDSNSFVYTETVSTPPLSPIYKSIPPLQEVPEMEPLPSAGPTVEELHAQAQAQAPSPPQLQPWPMPAPAAPFLADLPPVQVVDTDLGRTIENMVRTFDPTRRAPIKPDPEGAYAQLMSALQVGTYSAPESIVSLMNFFGRSGDVARVHQLYSIASVAVAGLVGNQAWQASAWGVVEDGMICALAHAGEGEMASIHRHRMIAGGKVPSANAYAALIATVKDTTDDALIAEELFDESQRLGCRPNTYLFNTVISKLSRARKAERALQLFQLMTSPELNLTPTSVTYGAVINAYVRTGDEDSAVQMFERLERDRGFKPRVPPYNTMIQFFTSTKPDRAKAEVFINKMRKWQVEPSAHTYKLFLDLYGNVEPVLPEKVSSIFSQLVADPKVKVQGTHWASLITSAGICQSNLDEAISIFESIASHPSTAQSSSSGKPTLPDSVSFEALLSVFIHHSRGDLMKSWIQKIHQNPSESLNPTAYIANVLIKGYSSTSIEEAREVFEEMVDPPAGIAAHGNHLPRQHGAGAGSIVPESPVPSHNVGGGKQGCAGVYREPSTYETMIKAELSFGDFKRAEDLIHRMEMRAFPPALIIKARGHLEEARVQSA